MCLYTIYDKDSQVFYIDRVWVFHDKFVFNTFWGPGIRGTQVKSSVRMKKT